MKKSLLTFFSTFNKIDLALLVVLTLLPISRELIFQLFAHEIHLSTEDLIHVISEMVFLLVSGIFFITFHSKYKYEKKTNSKLHECVREKTKEINLIQKISIFALASLAENMDDDTGEHLLRIQDYVKLLTETLKIKPQYKDYLGSRNDYVEDISLASILHDVGKVGVPHYILTSPNKLSYEDFEIMKKHTIIAYKILEKANNQYVREFKKDSYLALARDISLSHHEKWDGSGYPHNLKGEEIPLSARIVAIADVYDALTTARPYKSAWSHESACNYISEQRGKQFDPHIVDCFLAVEKKFDEISQRRSK